MPIEKDIEITYQRVSEFQVELKDMIGNPPGWLLRSGITSLAIVTTIILIGSYFFKYPDKLTGMGTLTSSTPPIEIISRTTGYIDQLEVTDSDIVKLGQTILLINNTTDKDEIDKLTVWIDEYEKINASKQISKLVFPSNLQLGRIQGDYAILQLKYNEYQQTLNDKITIQLINNIEEEISKINTLNRSQEKGKSLFSEELKLADKDFSRNEKLSNEGAISTVEMEKANTALLQKKRQEESMNTSIIQNNIRIEQLEIEKLKLRNQRSQTLQAYQFAISEIIARINASIEDWNESYAVKAPIDGSITFSKNITDQRNLNQGQVIGYIVPNENQQNYISAIYPSINIGKVESGQTAIIKFNEYPSKEYGVVLSKVGQINRMPEKTEKGETLYEIKIPLEDKIITDFNRTIDYRPNMTATVDIVTEDKTVFERVFNQLISLKNN